MAGRTDRDRRRSPAALVDGRGATATSLHREYAGVGRVIDGFLRATASLAPFVPYPPGRYALCLLYRTSPTVTAPSGPNDVGARRPEMNQRVIRTAAALFLSLAPLTGCREEGPAERAGKGVDSAVRDVKDAVNPPGPVEKAGRAVDDAFKK
jgi:hypothetical protein